MAEISVTAACTVTDPAERQRRLADVYGLLLELARRRRKSDQDHSGDVAHFQESDPPADAGRG